MNRQLLVLSGTGTGIGKTHFAEALLLAAGSAGLRATGLKPVESGVVDGEPTDAGRLHDASTFHVKHEGLAFALPVSPHLAARAAGATISLEPLVAWVERVRAAVDLAVVELPGGLFSPLSTPPDANLVLNADLAARLGGFLVLLAPDRLGVLHDVVATLRAAAAMALAVDLVVLGAPATGDASTGTNATELAHIVRSPVVGTLARATVGELARGPLVREVLGRLGAGRA